MTRQLTTMSNEEWAISYFVENHELRAKSWMDLDRQYIDEWSLWFDLNIVAEIISAVLEGRGVA